MRLITIAAVALSLISSAGLCLTGLPKMTPDEAKVAALLRTNGLSPQEQEQVALIMSKGNYYGMKVELVFRSNSHDIKVTTYAGATPDRMETLTNWLSRYNSLTSVRVSLWREPSAKVRATAQAEAQKAIKQIYTDIAALRTQYPELELFDEEHVQITDSSLHFSPNKAERSKIEPPYISVSFQTPYLGAETQGAFPTDLFPLQQTEFSRLIYVESESLQKKIAAIMSNAAQPMAAAERSLGSEVEVIHR